MHYEVNTEEFKRQTKIIFGKDGIYKISIKTGISISSLQNLFSGGGCTDQTAQRLQDNGYTGSIFYVNY